MDQPSPRRRVRGTSEEEAERAADRAADATVDATVGSPGPEVPPALRQARLIRGAVAARLTDALGAAAVTVGGNVFLSPTAPSLTGPTGRRLLAHELTHVVQQQAYGRRAQLFSTGERSQIAPDLSAMMAVVSTLVNASCRGNDVIMDDLVRHAGGRTASDAMPEAMRSTSPPTAYLLTLRYLFTRRCGLIDMRHFFQLLYVSWFFNTGNAAMAARAATSKGIEHEETSEAASKFGGEDLPSNALGAWTATRLAGFPQRDDLMARVRESLAICGPVDFSSLSLASQGAVVDFYAEQTAAGEPLNQNRTAVALIPAIPELAGSDRSFPFALDSDDPRRATISGPDFAAGPGGLTGDSAIRDFVTVQREEVLRSLSATERVRICTRLMTGWVSDADLDALERLYRLADGPTRAAIRSAAPAGELTGRGQRIRLQLLYEQAP